MKPTALPAKKAGIIFLWLLAWQAISLSVHNSIILVGPLEVVRALWVQAAIADFWKTIALSFGKISLGFLLAFGSGILAGGAAWRFPLLKDLLEPLISLIKSVPVASFVILALIWVGSENLSVFIAFLVVFPIIYINTIAGFMSTDPKLLEMARVSACKAKRSSFIFTAPPFAPTS